MKREIPSGREKETKTGAARTSPGRSQKRVLVIVYNNATETSGQTSRLRIDPNPGQQRERERERESGAYFQTEREYQLHVSASLPTAKGLSSGEVLGASPPAGRRAGGAKRTRRHSRLPLSGPARPDTALPPGPVSPQPAEAAPAWPAPAPARRGRPGLGRGAVEALRPRPHGREGCRQLPEEATVQGSLEGCAGSEPDVLPGRALV